MLEILPDIEILPDARNVTVCRNTTKDQRTNGMLEILPDVEILPDAYFEVPRTQNGIEVPRVQNGIFPTDRRAPIKMVSGRAWSPGIYQSLRLLGKSIDVAWERVFIRPLTFN